MAVDPRDVYGSDDPAAGWLRWLLIGAIAIGALAHALATLQPVFSDEFLILGNLRDFVQNRTLIPEHARYPTLFSYMALLPTGVFVLVSIASGLPPALNDFSAWMAYNPLVAIWPARLVSLACWGVCAWAVHAIALQSLRDRRGALVATAAFAATIGTLEYTGYGLPDTAMMMWAALALLFALRLMRSEEPRALALYAGILAGLAIATKYSAIAVMLPVLIAALMAQRPVRHGLSLLGHVLLGAALGFVAGSPGWIVAHERFLEGLLWERAHMARGHLGYTGVPVLGQLELLARADLPLMVLAALGGIIWVMRRPGREVVVLLVAVAAVMMMAAPARKQSLHYLFVLYPVGAVLIAGGLTAIGHRARPAVAIVIALICVGSALWGLWWGYRVAVVPDSLQVARQWINAQVPDDAVVAMDWIGVPRLVSEREVAGLRDGMTSDFARSLYAGLRTFPTAEIEYTDAFLRDTEADWLVTSSACYARFFEFGRFTRIPPSPESEIRREFTQRRGFYRSLRAGEGGWRLAHQVRTGNGPTVQIYRRL